MTADKILLSASRLLCSQNVSKSSLLPDMKDSAPECEATGGISTVSLGRAKAWGLTCSLYISGAFCAMFIQCQKTERQCRVIRSPMNLAWFARYKISVRPTAVIAKVMYLAARPPVGGAKLHLVTLVQSSFKSSCSSPQNSMSADAI